MSGGLLEEGTYVLTAITQYTGTNTPMQTDLKPYMTLIFQSGEYAYALGLLESDGTATPVAESTGTYLVDEPIIKVAALCGISPGDPTWDYTVDNNVLHLVLANYEYTFEKQ